MTSLKSQRRLASQILKIGQNRVWIDPERTEDAEAAITHEDVRKLFHEGVIKALPKKGVSRSRAKVLHEKRRKGLRSGSGSRVGGLRSRISKKEAWMSKIRALRKRLRELRTRKIITDAAYRELYRMASSGRFESAGDLERYLKAHEMWRKR